MNIYQGFNETNLNNINNKNKDFMDVKALASLQIQDNTHINIYDIAVCIPEELKVIDTGEVNVRSQYKDR